MIAGGDCIWGHSSATMKTRVILDRVTPGNLDVDLRFRSLLTAWLILAEVCCWMLLRVSQPAGFMQEISSFFVEILRGVPMLVLLYYISFVGAPALVAVLNWLGQPLIACGTDGGAGRCPAGRLSLPGRSWRLALGYGAFISRRSSGQGSDPDRESTRAKSRPNRRVPATGRSCASSCSLQAVRNVLTGAGQRIHRHAEENSPWFRRWGCRTSPSWARCTRPPPSISLARIRSLALLYLVMTLGLSLLVRWTERNLKL